MSPVDLIAASNLLYEQELFWQSDFSSPAVQQYGSGVDLHHEWTDDMETVPSSQPFEDGEEDLQLPPVPVIPRQGTGTSTLPLFCHPEASSPPDARDASIDIDAPHPRRAHLVFRASPVKPKLAPTVTQGTGTRPRKLVRRVTMDAEIERRRKRACKKARHIVKKIRALATATMKLKRQHRNLCRFVGNTYTAKTK